MVARGHQSALVSDRLVERTFDLTVVYMIDATMHEIEPAGVSTLLSQGGG